MNIILFGMEYLSPVITKNKQPSSIKAFILSLAMLLAAGSTLLLKPTQKLAEQNGQFNLEAMVPKKFGTWQFDEGLAPLQVSHDKQALLYQIYSQNLSRTYLDNKGNRIMLSIAYGGDQSDSLQVHNPEVCYFEQGYQVQKLFTNSLDIGFGSILINHFLATKGRRVESVTYWIKIGDTVSVHSLKAKLVKIKYGLSGKIPDGLVFRVSNIGNESSNYLLQEKFIKDLLFVVSEEDRFRLIGKVAI